MEKNSTAYQVHIDGLRALAVLAVLFYHLNEHLVPGGYTGVDVFFVISGYLIVLGIISRLDSGQFSFLDFFHRRVKRIIPAYIGMICVSLAAGMILFPWEKLMLLGEAACFSALYCVNVYYVKFTGGYFDSASESSPLLNLWSLSVEQQFYIVIPFLLVGLYMLKGRRFFALFFCILSLSSIVFTQEALKIQLSNNHIGDLFFTSKSAFYMLHCRIWELLAGALIAVCPEIACWLKRKNWLAVIGIILIIIPYILYTKQTQFPGIAALPCVIGSVLVITSGSSGLPGRLLTFSPIVYIGKISYSLYL